MDFIVKTLKKFGMYEFVREKYNKRKRKKSLKNNIKGNYTFENRGSNKKKMCMILAGYKMFSAEIVFKRIKKFVPKDVDVCILSSGKYSNELSKIAEDYNWSYLSTKRNNVSLIQNIAINLFKSAEYIYKLDEDIFVTKNFFNTLYNTYNQLEKTADYKVGFVAPTIPINCIGNLNILKKYNLVDYYTKKFEKPMYALGADRMNESDKNAVEFFWGEGGYLPNIDQMDYDFHLDKFNYMVCPIRFSIGAILFKRSIWDEMNMFPVSKTGSDMGKDELDLCTYCMVNSYGMMISLNTVVGHMAFGSQNRNMENYFHKHNDVFEIHKTN